jgi:threonine dehydrogenase-like Zn-dependent dehydrogenase
VGQVVTFEGPRKVGIREYEERPLQPNEVRLRTLYSGISAGTELTAYRESNPYLFKRRDDDRRLFLEGGVSLQHPIEGWGCEEVGGVAEVGSAVTAVRLGEVVWERGATRAPRW